MKTFRNICLALFIISGCSMLKSTDSETPVIKKSQTFHAEIKNVVLRPELLEQARNLTITAFTAGVGVEATNQLEQISNHTARGIAEKLQNNTQLEVLSVTSQDEPDLILKGSIVRLSPARGVKSWMLGKRQKFIQAQGFVLDVKTNERVLNFSFKRSSDAAVEDLKSLALKLGHEIGNFIGASIKKGDLL